MEETPNNILRMQKTHKKIQFNFSFLKWLIEDWLSLEDHL
jgi:hypothetical protein